MKICNGAKSSRNFETFEEGKREEKENESVGVSEERVWSISIRCVCFNVNWVVDPLSEYRGELRPHNCKNGLSTGKR